ncbi:MAG: hypothetical protein RMZ41_010215 [Nostoc sp. DedVER02]|uniref:hypothetical protein n=1 Tax=unclassified Nostoc TaxID=2593658 RepID=UPI002AD49DF6|nr:MULTISPECIES: hypothetical protein [unclassified Nostoc]MDZ7985760.1 hypothetical protein [Nostoc sp. DedVER02]MDZ8111417.1 hypothetical protein [Nostoc sp. DedVER01b]
MLKIKHSQLNWLLVGMTLAVMPASIAPAFGQRAIVVDGAYGVMRSPAVSSLIYGSPIPTPMAVNPKTRLMPQRTDYPDSYYPQVRQNVKNSTPINPAIRDSTLVNPVIINNSWQRTPFSGGRCLTTSCSPPSRVIITYPR